MMSGSTQKEIRPGLLFSGFVLCMALGFVTQYSIIGQRLDAVFIDNQIRVLRMVFPVPAKQEVIVVGIDETDIQHFKEPVTLWHRHLGDFLRAMAEGRAAAVGIDMALPERSFNEILPGYDESLMTGILAAKRTMPVVLAVTVDSKGRQRPLYRKFQLIAGDKGMGLALFPRDADQTVRRFDERLAEDGSTTATLVGQVARGLGIDPGPGFIDYSVGYAFSYVPLHTVLDWMQATDTASLRRQFEGKPVMLGTVLPSEDRVLQPVNLAAWEDNANLAPGVLIHAQALRSVLGNGLVQPAQPWLVPLLIIAAALWWLPKLKATASLGIFLLWGCGLFIAGLWLFRQGWHIPSSGTLAAAFYALAGRTGLEAAMKLRERLLLKRSFSGSVSPVVMEEILAGKLSPELGGERKSVCILFADIRGFTTLSESMAPEEVIALLNRYFECVVSRIHDEGGAVICFMGDGIMAIFGAPKSVGNPSTAGLSAAKAMQHEVEDLNKILTAEGKAPIKIGVGLHAGEAVIGHVGSSGRHDYTAIGDATNVASRLEGITKEVGHSVVCSKAVAEALGFPDDLVALGPQSIKGHTPVEAYGWIGR